MLPAASSLQVSVGDKLTICLASTLNLDGTPGSTNYNPVCTIKADHLMSMPQQIMLLVLIYPCPICPHIHQAMAGQPSLMDRYDYVMHGKVRKGRSLGTSIAASSEQRCRSSGSKRRRTGGLAAHPAG